MNYKIDGVIAALDVGDARIGVAIAQSVAGIAAPHGVILNDDQVFQSLRDLVVQESITALVIGLPRDMKGDETSQTAKVRAFAERVEQELVLSIYFQDEAVTSVKAEDELGRPGSRYNKEMVDALAATYILEDFLDSQRSLIRRKKGSNA